MKKDFVFVGIQAILFLTYLVRVDFLFFDVPQPLRWLAIGIMGAGAIILLVALLQLNKSLSPFPTPKSNGALVQNGVYRLARHPIYTALLLCTFGYAAYTGSGWKAIVAAALYVLFYFKAKYEERLLIRHFEGYTDYMKKVGRFFPKR